MKHSKGTHLIPVLILSLLLVGCAAVKEASMELDTSAKRLKPPTGQSIIYVLRTSFLGFAVSFDVFLDNKYIGTTGGSRYIYTITSPGKHTLKSEAENDSFLDVNVLADSSYYVRQNVMMGFLKARNEIELLNPDEGRQALNECKLSSECVEIDKSKQR